jgi:hypothetical protein
MTWTKGILTMRASNTFSPILRPENPGAADRQPETVSVRKDSTLKLNFRDARLGTVLNYLRQSAGLIIHTRTNLFAEPRVDLWRDEPVSATEAIALLKQVLIKQGCLLIQRGRLFSIIGDADLKKTCIPLPSL